jgi:hypothetical protein
MGINSRKSLHPRWTTHHIRTIDGFKNCMVKIMRPNPDAEMIYDPVTRTYNNTSTVVYEGRARMQPYGINLDLEVANDPTARRLVLFQLEGKGLEINNDDMLQVVSTENNPDIMNYQYDIRGSIGSSLEWGTNLVCEANLKMSL